MNIPNGLTLFRILSIPFAVFFYTTQNYISCAIIVLLASLSDFFDGMIARKLDQCTELGSLLDPVADKLFEMSFMIAMIIHGDLPFYYVFLLCIRNTAQLLSIPILMWWKKINFKVGPKLPAKWGSAFGMIIICAILATKFFEILILQKTIAFLILVSAGFEIYMLMTYLPRFVQVYNGTHDTFD